MSKTTIFKLKQHVTKDDLLGAGFKILNGSASKKSAQGVLIYIPLNESTIFGYRVIQYNAFGTIPEDLKPEDIEDLVARGWVEEIEK